MCEIKSMCDFNALFEEPFRPRKILYSLALLDVGNNMTKQLAIELDEEESFYRDLFPFLCMERGCSSKFRTVHDYDVHCQSVHKVSCVECQKSFPSYNMLDVHIQEEHDSYFQAAIASNKAKVDCFVEGCDHSFSCQEDRDMHVLHHHKYPPNFKFKPLKSTVSKIEDMEVGTEDDLHVGATPLSSKNEPHVAAAPVRPRGQVPKTVCFGRGLSRTFQRAPRKKPSKDISMKELEDAL